MQMKSLGVVPLDEATDVSTMGGKAAGLAALRASGHRVPDGFVVDTAQCRQVHDGVPDSLKRAIAAGLARLGDGPFAVRSSAVAEDGASTSFAGQFLTVLSVRDLGEVCTALVRCVASAQDRPALAYREALAPASTAEIAVLVQRMVDAQAAGVAFSVNPMTGDDEVVVSAVTGLGDRLVNGLVTPEDWVLRDGVLSAPTDPHALDEETARDVATLVAQLANERGEPQDMEWAIADGVVHLLQSRAVTAAPVRPAFDDDPTEGVWTRNRAHYPVPMTAFGGSVYLPYVERVVAAWMEEHGLLAQALQQHWRSGDVYARVVPPGGEDGPAPPWWILAIGSRLVPSLRKRMAAAKRVVESGVMEERVRRWPEQRAELDTEIRTRDRRELNHLGPRERLAHLDEVLALMERCGSIHMRLFMPWLMRVHRATTLVEEMLGWPTERALALLAGHSRTSSAPGRELEAMAQRLRHLEGGRAALDDERPVEAIAEIDPAIADGLASWIDRWGLRGTGYDPGSPTLSEQPGLLWNMVRDATDDVLHVAATTSLDAELEAGLESLDLADRERLEHALREARAIFGLREDNVLYTDNLICGLARRAVLALGDVLVERGGLRTRELVVELRIGEIRAAIDGPLSSVAALASRRRCERAWVAAHHGPDVLCGEPTPPPTIRGLPAAGQAINEAFMWTLCQEYPEMSGRGQRVVSDADLAGIGAWPGVYIGTVRLVRSEQDLDKVCPGDVLVATITHPAWSVVFPRIGALVTDSGGALSHAAIVAREHAIPTVLNTYDATRLLRDGQRVQVDGGSGTVTIL